MATSSARGMFLKGLLVLNTILLPLAGTGLYLARIGKETGNSTLLLAGASIAAASPPLAGFLAMLVVKRLYRK